MDPKMRDIYTAINHPVNYHAKSISRTKSSQEVLWEDSSQGSLERMKETHVYKQKLSGLQKMQLINNRGMNILSKDDGGKQMKIMMDDLKMHETNKETIGGPFRLNQSLREHNHPIDKSCTSQRKIEMSSYTSSILPIYEGSR